MKLKTTFIVGALAAVASIHVASAAFLAPLPEFKSNTELQKTTHTRQIVGAAPSEAGAFYTGKPYETNQDGYLFKYRNFDSKLSRWTVSDMSGFPDGSNNNIYVCNRSISALDDNGLRMVEYKYQQSSLWLNVSGAFTLTGSVVGAGIGGVITMATGGAGSISIPVTTTLLGGLVGALAPGDFQATKWSDVTPKPDVPTLNSDEYFSKIFSVSYGAPTEGSTITDAVLAKSIQKTREVTVNYFFE